VAVSLSLWRPGRRAMPPKPRQAVGWPPKLLRGSAQHKRVSARELVLEFAQKALRTVS